MCFSECENNLGCEDLSKYIIDTFGRETCDIIVKFRCVKRKIGDTGRKSLRLYVIIMWAYGVDEAQTKNVRYFF